MDQVKRIISDNQVHAVADLNAEGKLLFEFLALIVDIKYRHKYGEMIANRPTASYSDSTQSNKVLADQVSPVDNGLLGH